MAEVKIKSIVSAGKKTIAVSLETPPEFEAAPGQFVTVQAPSQNGTTKSYYTISSPDTVDTFEITVAVGDENEVGSWLAERTVGEVITIEGPYGDIAYRGGAEVLVLAGGPGIGPGVGIGERAITDQDVVIIYRDDAFIHRERLTELEAAGATVTYLDPAEPIDRELIEEHLAKTVYVFGFEAFVQDATDAIDAAGGDPSSAQVEGFGPE